MPLIRRLPKRGFNNKAFKTQYLPVNLTDLNRFEDGTVVDEVLLRNAGLANGKADGIKILGRGELRRRLSVKVSAFSASAKAAIEKSGGTAEVVA
jgi:large subunit ribosomal protein L15